MEFIGKLCVFNFILPKHRKVSDKLNLRYIQKLDKDELDHLPFHPLLNKIILRSILKYLKQKELLLCRHICKEWNSEATLILRHQISPKSLHLRNVERFIEELGISQCSPIGKINLDHKTIPYSLVSTFFSQYGSNIVFLQIELTIHQLLSFPNFFQFLPNMKKLSVTFSYWSSIGYYQNSKIYIESSMSCTKLSQLEFLELQEEEGSRKREIMYEDYRGNIRRFVKHILDHSKVRVLKCRVNCRFLKLCKLSALNELDLSDPLSDDDLATLACKKLKLTGLRIRLHENVRSSNLNQFLHSISKSLQQLEIGSRSILPFCFPKWLKMEKLKELNLVFWNGEIKLNSLNSFSTPALISVKVKGSHFNGNLPHYVFLANYF